MVFGAMGLAALATLFVYHQSFDWMAWALRVLQRDEAGYPLFTLFNHMRDERIIRHGLDVRHGVVGSAGEVVPAFLDRAGRGSPAADREVLSRA